jgi:hypothetical protein
MLLGLAFSPDLEPELELGGSSVLLVFINRVRKSSANCWPLPVLLLAGVVCTLPFPRFVLVVFLAITI